MLLRKMQGKELEARQLKTKGGKNWVQRAAARWRCQEPQLPGKTRPRPSSPRNSMRVNCVGSLLNTQAIWSCTNGLIQVRNLLNVTFVGNTSLRQATFRLTYAGTLGRSHTSVKSVERGLQPLVTSSATSSFTLERSHTCVTRAAEGSATSAI